MATRELKIRVSAEDAGATQVMNRLNKAFESVSREAFFSVDFHNAQVAEQVKAVTERMQREADKHAIKVEAELIAKEANAQLFGPTKVPKRLALAAFVPSLADIEEAAAAQGPAIARGLFGDRTVQAARRAGQDVGGGFLESLKRTLGGRSDAKDLVELLRGSGPIAAVTLAARTLGDMGATAASLADQFYSGKINSRELHLELAKSIPIIGQIVRFGEGLDAWLGSSVKKAAELKLQMAAIAAAQERAARVGSIISPINNAAVLVGLGSADAARTRAAQEADARLDSLAVGWEMVKQIQHDMLKFGNQYYPSSEENREPWEKLKAQRDRLREQLTTAEMNSQKLLADTQRQIDEEENARKLAGWEAFMRKRRTDAQAAMDESARKEAQYLESVEQRLRQRHSEGERRMEQTAQDVASIRERIATPAEQFQKEAQHYAELYRQGLLTQDEAIRATRQAGERLEPDGPRSQPSPGLASAQIAGLLTGVIEQSRNTQVEGVKRTNKLLEDAVGFLRKLANPSRVATGEPIL
jgi:hypothetical protein